jgi:hypothetical protein
MGMTKMLLVTTMLVATTLLGCAGVTKRANRRAESHVKFHASRQLDCDEAMLSATCLKQSHTGECSEYQIAGCNNSIVYVNIAGAGWTTGE